MNIWLLAQDDRLAGLLKQIEGIQSIQLLRDEEEREAAEEGVGVRPDMLIVSDRDWGLRETLALCAGHKDARCFYLLSSGSDSAELQRIHEVCSARGIECLPPYRTANQIAEDIANRCFHRTAGNSNVIAAAAAQPQSGLTTSVLRLAIRLAEMADIRIGVLGMNGWNPGDCGFPYQGKYLDEVWGTLQGKQLSPAELPSKMHSIARGVYYLAGNRDIKKLYYYQPEGAGWLIECAKANFDLVLLDTGSYLDHGLAAQSIHASDLLFVQLTQSVQAREQWRRTREQIMEPILGLDHSKTYLWMNRLRVHSPELETPRQLSKQLDLPCIGALPEVPELLRAEAEGKLLSGFLSERYDAELDKVCRTVLDYYKIPLMRNSAAPVKSMPGTSPGWTRWFRWGASVAEGVAGK